MGQLLLFFLCNFSGFFSYVGGILVTNQFLLLLIDRCILAIQKTITNYCDTLWSVAIFWTSSEALPPEALALSNPFQKTPFFAVLMYALCGHRRYFTFKRKYQQYGPCFQTISRFLIRCQIYEQKDYSEEITCDNKNFHSIILQPFQFEPEENKTSGN